MTRPVRKKGSGDERLANIVGALALAVADQIAAATERAAGQAAATPAALVALHDLLAGRSIDDLRRAVGRTHSGTVRLVDRLVADGLALRRPSEDGRAVAVALTPRGRRLARRTMTARRAELEDILAILDPRERAQLTAITEKLVENVVARRLKARAGGHEPPGGWLCRLCDPDACERPDGRCPAASAAAIPP